jgi:hypothetical protein
MSTNISEEAVACVIRAALKCWYVSTKSLSCHSQKVSENLGSHTEKITEDYHYKNLILHIVLKFISPHKIFLFQFRTAHRITHNLLSWPWGSHSCVFEECQDWTPGSLVDLEGHNSLRCPRLKSNSSEKAYFWVLAWLALQPWRLRKVQFLQNVSVHGITSHSVSLHCVLCMLFHVASVMRTTGVWM